MSGRKWNPYDIEIILHHYCSRAPWPQWDAPAYGPATAELVRLGILESLTAENDPNAPTFEVTEKGRAFVELLLQTPEPRNVWLDPRDNKEIMEERMFYAAVPDSAFRAYETILHQTDEEKDLRT